MADNPTFLSGGHSPRNTDTKWMIEQRILGALTDGGTVMKGAGAPSNANGSDGDLYVRTSNGVVYSKANGVWGLA
jgi:hypothetical protein